MTAPTCRHCHTPLTPGIAMGQTYVGGVPDFPGENTISTISAGGPGVVVQVLKCQKCGWSVTP